MSWTSLPKDLDHSKRVQITTMPNITVWVYPSDEHPGWWVVKPMITAPERESGALEGFQKPMRFKRKRAPGRKRLAKWVRRAVRSLLHHELDEGLLIDGVRVFDPHAEEEKNG